MYLTLLVHLNMTNGIVNGAGLETQFGEWRSLGSRIEMFMSPLASLGINGTKQTYIPPHMRGQQRAASTPAVPTNG